jgi:hypothetical protein
MRARKTLSSAFQQLKFASGNSADETNSLLATIIEGDLDLVRMDKSTIFSRSDRNDYKNFSLLSPKATNLMRRLASKIKAVTLFHYNIFAVELDDDSSADHEQHFFAGVRSSRRRFVGRGQ